MGAAIDITGQHFGRLIAVHRAGRAKNGNALWFCQCQCGRTCVVDSYVLRHGKTRSCGCLAVEQSRQNIFNNPQAVSHMGDPRNLKIRDHHTDVSSIKKSKRNTSGVVGVSYDKQSGSWVAHFYYKGSYILNKHFAHFEDAVRARHAMEQQYLTSSDN